MQPDVRFSTANGLPNLIGMAAGIMGLGHSLAQPMSAAPAAATRSQITAFETSPFPYAGSPPGQDKPFFDIEKDGRRGHSSPRGGIYWEDTTYSDRSVLLFIPRGFDPARPGLLIVYLHGNLATLDRDVQKRQQVPRQVLQSGLNAVLMAPQFAVNALDSSAGRFYEPGEFRRFLEEGAGHLARLQGDERTRASFDALPVLIVAYSGGYAPAAWAIHNGGAGDRVRGVILLDALYAEMDKFADWIAQRESAFFFSAYSRSAREENLALQRLLTERSIDFSTTLPSTLAPGGVTFFPTGEDVVHNDFVSQAWVRDPLKAVLGKIAGYPRRPAGTSPVRKR